MKLNKSWGLVGLMGGILSVMLLMSNFSGAAPAGGNIGYVDPAKLMEEMPEYVKFKEQYKNKSDELNLYSKNQAQQHTNAMKALQEKAEQEKKGKSASEQEAIAKKYNDEAQRKTEAVRASVEQKKVELSKSLDTMKKEIDENVKRVIADVAKEKKLDVVIDKNVTYYGGTDISKLVIDKAKKNKKKD